MLNVILAKSYDAAIETLGTQTGWVVLETEYGQKTIDERIAGVACALNHHGDLQLNDAPALAYKKNIQTSYDNFLVSHIDLDVLFGILWTAGWLKPTKVTIELAELVATADIKGFHAVKELLSQVDQDIVERYYAIGYLVNSWIINDNGLVQKNISKEVHKLLLLIKDIILNGATPKQIHDYTNWFKEQENAAKKHLLDIREIGSDVRSEDKLFVYRAPFRLTTAYEVHNEKAVIIVQYNEQSKSISLSCFNDDIARSYFGRRGVITPLKVYFGSEAGGKCSIGGTSRSHDMQPESLNGFIEFLFREYFNIPEVHPLPESTDSKTVEISYENFNSIRECLVKNN